MRRVRQGVKWGMGMRQQDAFLTGEAKGTFIFDMWDAETGEVLAYWEKSNVITRDAGILACSLFSDDAINPAGITMLAVGTGATGDPLNPDVPTSGQRALNSELARKAFSSSVYRDTNGVAVSIRTNIRDYTTTFSESEAVGALNEMGLLSPADPSGFPEAPILNGPANYDPTIDVDGYDLFANYLTFGTITKPATAILSITWRLTF
jgi:hypothetical protein